MTFRGRRSTKGDGARVLVASQPPLEQPQDLGLGQCGDDDGDRYLAPAWIGAPHHGGLGDALACGQDGLELGGIDVLATRDHHVLLAVVDPEAAVGIAVADVARPVPAALQRRRRRPRIVPVARHHVGPAHQDFAADAVGHVMARFVDHAHVDMGGGGAAGTDLGHRPVGPQADCGRAGLGRAVDLAYRHAAGMERVDQRRRHRRRNRS